MNSQQWFYAVRIISLYRYQIYPSWPSSLEIYEQKIFRAQSLKRSNIELSECREPTKWNVAATAVFFIDVIVLRSSRTFYNTAAAAPSPLCAHSQMLPPHRWPFAADAHCSYSSLNTLFALYTLKLAVLRPTISLPVLRQQIWRTVSINYFHSIIIL